MRKQPKNKQEISQSSISSTSSIPIALGPPPPPPPAPAVSNSKFNNNTKKGKQGSDKVNSTSSNYRWDRDGGKGDWPLGLDNLGNTCFMNSALQCLSRTRSLLDKLDLYGRGNVIEIIVSSEEPCVQILNPCVDLDLEDQDISSEFADKNFLHQSFCKREANSSQPNRSADSSEQGSGDISPSSTEIDSLLDASSTRPSRKSESDGSGVSSEMQIWKKELKLELTKPLKLRLAISKESMTSKLRDCFNAITKSSDSPDAEENVYYRSVFSPRAIQLAVSKHFRLGHQHDSHELLRTVVDMMKKDQIRSFRLAIMQRYGVKRNEGKNCDPKLTELLKMWDRRLYHKTFVDEIFGGELVTFQECLQCRNIRRSHEEFLDLSLPIRAYRANPIPTTKRSIFDDDHDYVINRSVEECLRAYTEPEFLTGSNAVECEHCHRMNLERLANGAAFEMVFPGLNLNAQSEKTEKSAPKSKYPNKKQNKKRQNRQAKLKAKLNQTFEPLSNSTDSKEDPTLKLVEDHFNSDKEKPLEKVEDDSKSSKSGSLDDYVVVQNASTLNHQGQLKSGHAEIDMDYDSPELEVCPAYETVQEQSSLSRGLSSSLKSLTLIEAGMDFEPCPPPEEDMNMDHNQHDPNLDELMDDLEEPAVDGLCHDSDDESNGLIIPPIDLESEKTRFPITDYYRSVPGSNGAADEGFSEGETSSEGKPSQSVSESSSRNSISEVDTPIDDTTKARKKIPITKCPCSRRQLISRAPECLTLHLKRFQHTTRGSSKLSDKVTFPYILNLTEFCSEVDEDKTKPGFKTMFDEDGEVVYSLYGIVEHSGSLHFGHYVAYVKVSGKTTESGEKTEDNWFYISDSHVARTTLKRVLTQDAYILFYERIRGPEKKERLCKSIEEVEVEKQSWSSSRSNYSYVDEEPVFSAPLVTATNWNEESWEEPSNQQVSSTNDSNDFVSMTLNYEVGPVTNLYFSAQSAVDHVSSTTEEDVTSGGNECNEDMDFSTPNNLPQ